MRNTQTREGFEFWDKLNALPRYAFLLSPSGKSVQKFEDQAMGNWIDVHEAQKVVDQAQEVISELRDEIATSPKPDPVLCKFYDVTDWPGLVRELVGHVDQLQESAKRNVKPWEDTFPPTLLPTYIERVNAANAAAQPQDVPVEWGAPKTVRQLVRQLETLDPDLRPLSMLRVPASVFEDGKERVRATHLSFSHERVDGQWLAPFKSDGEKVLAFWCRMEQPAPITVVHPFAEKVIRKLERFQECADDGQGADIGRHWFDLLTQLGLLNRVQRSPALWEMTQQGEDALELSRQSAKSR